MSGIAGIRLAEDAAPLTEERLRRMAAALDPGEGVRVAILAGGRVGLAASAAAGYDTLLATRNVGGAEAGLALHGLVTNVRDLCPDSPRDRLATELLERFLRDGAEKAALALRGEFAFAFWDGRVATFAAGVDRIRVQSLVFANPPGALVVASRLRALLRAPVPLRPTLHPASLMDVVGASIVATPRTIFREIEKVPPGSIVTTHGATAAVRAYWDVDYTDPSDAPVARLRAETRDALEGALQDRLALDVPAPAGGGDPVGAFLSGGIDSSTVTGLLTRLRGAPVRTFSMGFSEERFNELSYARIVAKAFGTHHTEYFVTPADTLEVMDRIADGYDEPFANASAVPTYWCAKIARDQGVRALYAGDGGDELFAGNERYATSRVFGRYDRLPGWFRRGVFTPAVRLAGTLVPLPLFVKAKKYVQRASLPPAERMTSYGFWYLVAPSEILEPSFLATLGAYRPYAMSLHHYEHARARTPLDRHLYLDLKITIGDNDVPKVSRMCEQAGVAVRYPFLDERVVHAAERVPAGLKMRGEELRTFFKETYSDLLPPETLAKKKHGFGLPVAEWLRSDRNLNERMRDLVLGPRTLARGVFRRDGLEELVRRHAGDTTSFYGTALWNLMVLELWQRRVLDDDADRSRSE